MKQVDLIRGSGIVIDEIAMLQAQRVEDLVMNKGYTLLAALEKVKGEILWKLMS